MLALSLPLLALAASTLTLATPFQLAGRKQNSKPVSTHPQVKIEGDVCTVKPLGGARDDSSALIYAFQACNSSALIDLPGYYVVDKVLNVTLKNVEVRLSGAIQYTPNIEYWSPNSIYLTYQNATTFFLLQGDGITMHGGGTIDGNGQIWWEAFARNKNRGVAGGSSRTFSRPIPLVVGNAKNVLVKDIKIVNSPFWHNLVYQSSNVTYDNIFIQAVSYNQSIPTANSDGWDIYRSDHVTIKNSNVNNQDDCVSLKPNSTFINVENMICNGSHGISIGSLGQYASEVDIVSDVYVHNISMSNAENGARIKVFGGSNDTKSISGGGTGYVRNVTFSDFRNTFVDYPILIDQCYNTPAAQCAAYPSSLKISDIHYINVTGTSSGLLTTSDDFSNSTTVLSPSTVVKLSCSAICENITAVGTNLRPPLTNETAQYICANLANQALLDFPCTAPKKA